MWCENTHITGQFLLACDSFNRYKPLFILRDLQWYNKQNIYLIHVYIFVTQTHRMYSLGIKVMTS